MTSQTLFPISRLPGFRVAAGTKIDRVSVDNITPQKFFTDYVAKRRPVILVGKLDDEDWKPEELVRIFIL